MYIFFRTEVRSLPSFKMSVVECIDATEDDKMSCIPKVQRLFELPHYEQRSEEWFAKRLVSVNSSEAASLHEDSCRPFDSRKELFCKKINKGKEFKGNKFTEHGVLNEPIATEKYAEVTGEKVFLFGLLPHHSIDRIACSPDAITASGRVVEIKCPFSRKITSEVPPHYMPQLQHLMDCLDLEVCDFVQFRPETFWSVEEFVITVVHRDRVWFAEHLRRINIFWKQVDEYKECGKAYFDVEEFVSNRKEGFQPRKAVNTKLLPAKLQTLLIDPNDFMDEHGNININVNSNVNSTQSECLLSPSDF